MEYKIRKLDKTEYNVLEDFLYEAIFIPEGVEAPPREIINQPELQVYIAGFGTQEGDTAVCAEADGKLVGAAWARIMNDYGHIDDGTPSIAISLYKEYRGKGMGTDLLKALLSELKSKGYRQVSLAVQKENYAVRMYKKAGSSLLTRTNRSTSCYVRYERTKNALQTIDKRRVSCYIIRNTLADTKPKVISEQTAAYIILLCSRAFGSRSTSAGQLILLFRSFFMELSL